MPRHRTQAIVLSTTDYGEFDRIVALCTRDSGRITGIAKGAKRSIKRFGGALETGSSIEVSLFEKKGASLTRLEHCDLLDTWKSIRGNLEKFLVMCQILEMVRELLPEREKNSEVFLLLLHMITLLEKIPSPEPAPFLLTFEVKLLRLIGFRPNLEHCVVCKKVINATEESSLGFNPVKGGVVCSACRRDEKTISCDALDSMKTALKMKVNDIPSFVSQPNAVGEARSLLREFLEMRIGKRLKSPDVAQSLR